VTARLGASAPELPLVHPDGTGATLGDFRGEAVVLIFLRHLG
jgi:peroxiredoxin